jgi:hypothetical protein
MAPGGTGWRRMAPNPSPLLGMLASDQSAEARCSPRLLETRGEHTHAHHHTTR